MMDGVAGISTPSFEPLRVARGRLGPAWGIVLGSLLFAVNLAGIIAGRDGWFDGFFVLLGAYFVIEGLVDLRRPLLEISPGGVVHRRSFPLPSRRIPAEMLEGWRCPLGRLHLQASNRDEPFIIDLGHLSSEARAEAEDRLRTLAPEIEPHAGA